MWDAVPAHLRFFCLLSAKRRRGISSAGRAPPLQGGGHRFESGILHRELMCNVDLVSASYEGDFQSNSSLTTEYENSIFAGYVWSSAEGHTVDALALAGEEGRSKLR